MITVHGRYQKEMFSGTVHYSEIAEAVRLSSVPVTGNGDIIDFISLKKMLATGCRAVMIGRGAVGSPWIFYLLKGKTACLELKDTEVFPHSDFAIPGLDLLYLKRNTFSLNMAALIRVAMFHYNASADFYGEIKGLKEFRKHFARYIAGFPSLRDLRMEFFNSKTREESLQALHKYLAVCGEYFK
ncbi:MAG TPA: hypothetical protein DC049_05580 [Spirochaetia bacterium]|nr:hypothetical protein [Spirochaetia bacterium]